MVDMQKIMHTKVDSMLTAKPIMPKLNAGHYLKVEADKNWVNSNLITIQGFYPLLMNNGQDLSIKVQDTLGNNISTAKVWVDCERIRYNKATQSYFHPKMKLTGMLTIEYDGLQVFQKIDDREKFTPSLFRPFVRGLNFTKYTIHDISRGRTPYWLHRSWNRLTNFIANPSEYFDKKFRRSWTGYLVFNKPMYRPNDTVHFKTFIMTNKSGKLLNKPIDVILSANSKKIMTLSPYTKGAYESSFVLNDSLNLSLDHSYTLSLAKKNSLHKEYINASFRYDDYELKSTTLNLRTQTDKQYVGDSL